MTDGPNRHQTPNEKLTFSAIFSLMCCAAVTGWAAGVIATMNEKKERER